MIAALFIVHFLFSTQARDDSAPPEAQLLIGRNVSLTYTHWGD
jgi:hypothetical protein